MKNNKSYPTKNQSVMCVCVKSYIQYIWIYIPFSFDYFEKIFLFFFSSPTTTILLLLAVKSTFYSLYFFPLLNEWMNGWIAVWLSITITIKIFFGWYFDDVNVCVCVCRLACHLSSSSYSIFCCCCRKRFYLSNIVFSLVVDKIRVFVSIVNVERMKQFCISITKKYQMKWIVIEQKQHGKWQNKEKKSRNDDFGSSSSSSFFSEGCFF